MTKLVIDTASILTRFMYTNDEEFGVDIEHEGNMFHIPDHETLMERAKYTYHKTLDELGLKPVDAIFVLEQPGSGQRRKLWYADYKLGRTKKPKEWYNTYNKFVEEFVEYAMRKGAVSCVAKVTPSVESDDLVAEICKRFPDTIAYFGDKDLLAVEATHHLYWDLLDPIKFPVPRDLIKLYRTVVSGDASDNIPSCSGFGPKTWDKLKELIGWDGLYELDKMVQEKRLHELKEDVADFPKLQLLIDQADTIYLAYKLHTFIHVPAHKVKWMARVTDCEQKLVTADNFDQCYAEVVEELRTATHCVIDYETSVPEESFKWLEGTNGAVKVDVFASQITGMGLKINDKCWYFSVNHANTNNITLDDLEKIINEIKEMEGYAQNLVGFENVVTYNHFECMFEKFHDTRVMSSYVDENEPQGLKRLSSVWLNYEQETYEQTIGAVEGARQMCDISGEQVLSYGLADVITTDAIHHLFKCIMIYEGTWEVFKKVEQLAGLVTSLAFCKGVDFDWDVYNKLKEENDANIIKAESELETMLLDIKWGEFEFKPFALMNGSTVKEFYRLVTGNVLQTQARSVSKVLEDVDDPFVVEVVMNGIDAVNAEAEKHFKPKANFNTRSPKQVGELMYEKFKLPVRIRNMATDTMRKKGIYEGNPSTDDTAIANAIAFGDCTPEAEAILTKLLELKGYLTRESLFLSKYPGFVHHKTGKLHCNMQIAATTTRRFTHSAPQLGQLPKKKGREMRNMLTVPGDDWVMVTMDFSGQETRLAAWDSQDKNFLSCYLGTNEQHRDVHSMVAHQIMTMEGNKRFRTYEEFAEAIKDKDPEAKKYRVLSKDCVFGTQYGCRAKKLGQMLCVTEDQAQQFMNAKNDTFPELQDHINTWIKLCRDRGYSTTFLGARRHLAKKWAIAKSQGEIDSVDRLAWSFRIQGSAACMTKLAMGKCLEEGLIDNLSYLITTIHDECVFCVHKSVLSDRLPKIHACITSQYADMEIPLESTPEIGTHFGSLEEIDLTTI